jgi:hypothetical protein
MSATVGQYLVVIQSGGESYVRANPFSKRRDAVFFIQRHFWQPEFSGFLVRVKSLKVAE